MQETALIAGPWHPPTQDQKPVFVGYYDSTTWNPNRKDGFMPPPIRTFWDGKQWLWHRAGEPCKFQDRSWRGADSVCQENRSMTTLIAHRGGTIELVFVLERSKLDVLVRSMDTERPTERLIKKLGNQHWKEFSNVNDATDWIKTEREKRDALAKAGAK